METNIQEVINSLTRQIAELSVKLALAEARLVSVNEEESGEEE
jgi:hypothetical protein